MFAKDEQMQGKAIGNVVTARAGGCRAGAVAR